MKTRRVIGATALFLLFGTTVPVFAQEHHEQEAKPVKQEEQAKPARQEAQPRPEQQHQQQARSPQPAKPVQPQQHPQIASRQTQPKPEQPQQQVKSAQQAEQRQPQQHQQQAKSTHPAQTKSVRQDDHGYTGGQRHVQRTAVEVQRQHAVPSLRLSAKGNGRIPDDRFRSNFGRGHEFRIGSPSLVGGYSRFQYGGYWFGFVDPWPAAWYYTDDVYVDYLDGAYYLCDPYYPSTRIAISVVL